MISKVERVKSLFDVTEKYLNPRQFDIRIRTETIQEFTNGLTFDRVLDIGCGNGAISLPLLPRCCNLTLLDLSSKMLSLAGQGIPSERRRDVDFVKGNFLEADLQPASFDLVLCIGVLAHVDSVPAVIGRLSRLVKPGGLVVLEFTDSFHFWGLQGVIYQNLLKLLRPEPYALNRLRKRQVMEICRENGLNTSALYRYGLPPIGLWRIADQDQRYRMVRTLFGPSTENRNAWMGNQFIFRLQKA